MEQSLLLQGIKNGVFFMEAFGPRGRKGPDPSRQAALWGRSPVPWSRLRRSDQGNRLGSQADPPWPSLGHTEGAALERGPSRGLGTRDPRGRASGPKGRPSVTSGRRRPRRAMACLEGSWARA